MMQHHLTPYDAGPVNRRKARAAALLALARQQAPSEHPRDVARTALQILDDDDPELQAPTGVWLRIWRRRLQREYPLLCAVLVALPLALAGWALLAMVLLLGVGQ